MKVCAGIILYNPDIKRLVEVVNAIVPQVEQLVLVDNASVNIDDVQNSLVANGVNSSHYVWIKNETNLGIARALNQLTKFADSNGYEWILTLDQDGICGDNYIKKLFASVIDDVDYCKKIAMIAPLTIDRGEVGSEISSAAPTGKPLPETEDVSFCITSGSLTNVKAVPAIGGFNDWLFIDEVDREICLRLLQHGYRIVRVNTVELCHEHGLKTITRKFLWKKVVYHNYTPFRVYYQTRNLVYMLRKYGSAYYPRPYKRWFRLFFAFCVKFVFEPDRIQRLKAFCKGLKDGMVAKI